MQCTAPDHQRSGAVPINRPEAHPMSRNDQPHSDQAHGPQVRPPADIAMAGLLAAAGGLHLAALPGHLRSSTTVGAFFAVTAVAQLIGAVLVATRPSRRVAGAVVAGNLVLLGLWALSRTTGLPVGGDIGAREPLAALDGLAAAVELLAVLGALRHLSGRRAVPPVRLPGWQPVLAVGALWLISGGIGTTLAGQEHSHHADANPVAGSTGGPGHTGAGHHRH
jgi:hypothetical protein